GTPDPAAAQTALQAGIAAYRAGDLSTAETELAKASAADAANGDIASWYGFILLKRNKPAAAVPYLDKAVLAKPDVSDRYTNLGNALLLKPGRTAADTSRALESFQKVVTLTPASGEAHYNLGLTYSRLSRPRDAEKSYLRATELNPKDDRAFVALGQTYQSLDDFDNAANAYRAAATLTPQKADVWTNLGITESRRKTPDKQAAINALETARKLDGGNVQTLGILGKLYADTGKATESAEAFAAAASASPANTAAPDTATIRYNQGVMYSRAGKNTEAIAAYNEALTLKPDYYGAAFNAATLQYNAQNYPESSRLFALSTRLNPRSSPAFMNYGLSLLKQGDETGAMAAWKRSAELKPTDYAIRENLAGLYMRRKSFDDAIAVYSQNTRIRPNSGAAWNSLGLAQQRNGDLDGAITSFQTANKREPKFAPAYNNLGVVYEKRAQFKFAVLAYKKALAIDPGFAPATANLSRYAKK
ncbi:MAG: tetratricopeptide repeat protein, partial [Armatimonadetes bacterium]|nr:tetratricopeptide repeat protein [Armatimonadota bacterium]